MNDNQKVRYSMSWQKSNDLQEDILWLMYEKENVYSKLYIMDKKEK